MKKKFTLLSVLFALSLAIYSPVEANTVYKEVGTPTFTQTVDNYNVCSFEATPELPVMFTICETMGMPGAGIASVDKPMGDVKINMPVPFNDTGYRYSNAYSTNITAKSLPSGTFRKHYADVGDSYRYKSIVPATNESILYVQTNVATSKPKSDSYAKSSRYLIANSKVNLCSLTFSTT